MPLPLSVLMSSVGYIAYIDESGDFGLRRIAPIDGKGASEWLVLSAAVIRAENEAEVPRWLREIRYAAKNNQSQDLHFRTLTDRQKAIVCEGVANCDVRLFTVISNKKNMRQYKNASAAHISNTRSWLYWWMCRLLMERITEFCEHWNEKDGTLDAKLRIEFSRRQDLKYHELRGYFTRLLMQSNTGSLYLAKKEIKWSVIDFDQIQSFDHRTRAGLQFADVVASAFFQAISCDNGVRCNPEFAERLKPRVWKPNGQWFDAGVKVLPFPLKCANLSEDQKRIFSSYGYPDDKW